MLLSIIMPVFNERKTVMETLGRVLTVDYNKEVIVVDDGSEDGTREILMAEAARDAQLKVIAHERNMGKGAAIRSALKAASGDIVIIQDADLEYNPADYPRLLKPILDGRADVVYGTRFVGSEEHRILYFWHYLGNKFLTLLSNMVTNLNLTDMETGYKVFRMSVLKQLVLEQNRFGFEPEVTAKIARMQCRVYEVGISYSGRTYAEGKKITLWDGVTAIYCILKYGLFRYK
jgi:glycosyltransferase involved in cell wall biosynthesis